MIVKMDLTKPLNFAKENIANVQNRNSVAEMANVSQVDGDAIMKTIVAMVQTNLLAKTLNAKMAPSSVLLGIVLLRTLDAMEIVIVVTCRMS